MIKRLIVILLLIASPAMAADIAVDTTGHLGMDQRRGLWGPFWTSPTVGALIFIDDQQDLNYARTINAGSTWATTLIHAAEVRRCAAYFDKETSGDTGDKLHIAWLDSVSDDALYRTLDIATDTLGTQRTVDATNTIATTAANNRLAITKSRGGKIFIAYSTQSELECYRSTDEFATAPTACTDPYETTTQEDWLNLFPANRTDNNDIAGIFWDRSDNLLSIKVFDDSADSWTETAIAGTFADDTQHINMDGATRHSDGKLLICIHNNDDNAGDDLQTYTITLDEGTTSSSAGANIFTNQAESAQCAVIINQQNDDVYVAHFKGGTWQVSVDVAYNKSVNDMVSWNTVANFNDDAANDNRIMSGSRSIGDDGGMIMWSWTHDDSGTVLIKRDVTTFQISAVTTTTTTTTVPGAERRVFLVQ